MGNEAVAAPVPNKGAVGLAVAVPDPNMLVCAPNAGTVALLVIGFDPKIFVAAPDVPPEVELVAEDPKMLDTWDPPVAAPPNGVAIAACEVLIWKLGKAFVVVEPAPNIELLAVLCEVKLLPPKVNVVLDTGALDAVFPNLNIPLVAWLAGCWAVVLTPPNIDCPPKLTEPELVGFCCDDAELNPDPKIGATAAVVALVTDFGAPKRLDTVFAAGWELASVLTGVWVNEILAKGAAPAEETDPVPKIEGVVIVAVVLPGWALKTWLNRELPAIAADDWGPRDIVELLGGWPNRLEASVGNDDEVAIFGVPKMLLVTAAVVALGATNDGMLLGAVFEGAENENVAILGVSVFSVELAANVAKLTDFAAEVEGLNLKLGKVGAIETVAVVLKTVWLSDFWLFVIPGAKEKVLCAVDLGRSDCSHFWTPNLKVAIVPPELGGTKEPIGWVPKENEGTVVGAVIDVSLFVFGATVSVGFGAKLNILGAALNLGGTTEELKLMFPNSEDDVLFARSEVMFAAGVVKLKFGFLTSAAVAETGADLEAETAATQLPSFDIPNATFWVSKLLTTLGAAILPATDDIIVCPELTVFSELSEAFCSVGAFEENEALGVKVMPDAVLGCEVDLVTEVTAGAGLKELLVPRVSVFSLAPVTT